MIDIQQARADAARWATALLETEFVIFDSETTGLGPQDEFVQVGVIDGHGNVLLDTLVKPTRPIDPGAARVHGLSAVHLVRERAFSAVYPELAAVLGGRRVAVYNADFDRRILHQTCALYGLPVPQVQGWECVMRQYAAYRGSWNPMTREFRWTGLGKACAAEAINVHTLNAHAAIDDCLMTLRLIEKMAASARG